MTRTGTRRGNRRYSYYSCAGCQQKGKSVCKGRHVPLDKLDARVLTGMTDLLLQPDRVEQILEGLIQRSAAKDQSLDERRHKLQAELDTVNAKITRLYRAIEEDVIPLDDELAQRIAQLKQQQQIAQEALERISANKSAGATITPQKIAAFTELMRTRLQGDDIRAHKDWLGSLVDRIEVGDDQVTIIGSKQVLATALGAHGTPSAGVRGFVRKWRALQDSNLRPQA